MIVDVKDRFERMRASYVDLLNEVDKAEQHIQTLPFELLPDNDDWDADIYLHSVDFNFNDMSMKDSDTFVKRLVQLRKELKVFTPNTLELKNIVHLYDDRWAVIYGVDLSSEVHKYSGEFSFYVDEKILLDAGFLKKGCSIKERTPSKTIVCSKE